MIVLGEKGLVLFNFYVMTQGTTAFLSSFSVLFIDAGNSRFVWLRRIHRIYLFSLLYDFLPMIGLKVFLLAF